MRHHSTRSLAERLRVQIYAFGSRPTHLEGGVHPFRKLSHQKRAQASSTSVPPVTVDPPKHTVIVSFDDHSNVALRFRLCI